MKTAALASALAVLALGGCQQPPTQDNNAAAAAPAAVPTPAEKDYYADRINALSDKERNAVLLKAIADAGGECPVVTGSAPHPPVEGRPAWTAHCAAGKELRALDWIVILQPGGMMRIVRPGAL